MKSRFSPLLALVLVLALSLSGAAPAQAQPRAAVPVDPIVQLILSQITQDQILTYTRQLAGDQPMFVDGANYTLASRNTYSGTDIQKATSFVGQHMAALGLDVDYHTWGGATYPNVIGEIPGLINPEQIYIIGAHLDDMPSSGRAPGADDNASGSVATLLAADLLSEYNWSCTLRFAFWTGEEQGLNGSAAYATRAAGQNESIISYLNLDMIAYNTISSEPGIDLRYNPNITGSQALAQLFADVIDTYELDLVADIGTTLAGGSDHESFWDQDYNSILAIEDQSDFNPYYHTVNDTVAHVDPVYYTEFVKATIATFIHESGCLLSEGVGTISGTVTDATSSSPISGAAITLQGASGTPIEVSSEVDGSYTQNLLADTYTASVWAYGYEPMVVENIVVTADQTTTQDFALTPAETHVLSGTVIDATSSAPLTANITVTGSPETTTTNPATGAYSLELPPGSYTMHVTAAGHEAAVRDIVMADLDQIQNFALPPLPPVLLVDDDQNNPNLQTYYTTALDQIGVAYNIWDVAAAGDPSADDLSGYCTVIWYNGRPSSGTFSSSNEAAVASYLDGGGRFFLSGYEYLYENNLTTFGQNYLHIGSYSNDVSRTDPVGVAGDPIGDGLGPYTLTKPTGWTSTLWTDNVGKDTALGSGTPFKWSGSTNTNSVRFENATFKTVFIAWPLEAISDLSARAAVLDSVLDWFGCSCTAVSNVNFSFEPAAPLEGEIITFTGSADSETPVTFSWDFADGTTGTGQVVTHAYAAGGDYIVSLTAANTCSALAATKTVTIRSFFDLFLPAVVK
ncbi:MAG TPA: M28 family peptidase [Anaerolineaceae bacterium]|nr:M28 family peptidase [Anaerolineaceae bacterium]